jgi:hypothetical protein
MSSIFVLNKDLRSQQGSLFSAKILILNKDPHSQQKILILNKEWRTVDGKLTFRLGRGGNCHVENRQDCW